MLILSPHWIKKKRIVLHPTFFSEQTHVPWSRLQLIRFTKIEEKVTGYKRVTKEKGEDGVDDIKEKRKQRTLGGRRTHNLTPRTCELNDVTGLRRVGPGTGNKGRLGCVMVRVGV